MPNIFVESDNHYYHKNIIRFSNRKPSGWDRLFADEFEMNEYMIEMHNEIVKPTDIVIHCGDYALCNFFSELESVFKKLNGKTHLITGNHDHHSIEIRKRLSRLPFRTISDHNILWDNRVMFSHKPVLNPRYPNIHGHTHDTNMPSPMYFNACVEALDYKPVALEDVMKQFRDKGVM